jgi:hypothetical protein
MNIINRLDANNGACNIGCSDDITTVLTPAEIADWQSFFKTKQASDRRNREKILREKMDGLRAESRSADELENEELRLQAILRILYSWPEKNLGDFLRARALQKAADFERRSRGMLLQ